MKKLNFSVFGEKHLKIRGGNIGAKIEVHLNIAKTFLHNL